MQLPKPGEIRKPSKTLAGVSPIAVMCKPKKCKHGTCIYCPSLNVPQSYTPKSPPVLRAAILKYDAFKQLQSRLKAFKLMNHPVDKIELIIMGGNFLEYPTKYQNNFIKKCYDALNNKVSKNLKDALKLNQKAKHRCVALCIETRPDTCTDKDIQKMLSWGTTRVEIGVQCLDDNIYKFVNRGHKVKDVIDASTRLKQAGFKVGYHMMLGLPKSNPKKDMQMFKQLFKDQSFKPDQLKIYPTQVLQGAALAKMYNQGKYHPYSKDDIQELIIKIMKIIPNYCRVMRIMREIAPDFLIAGTTRIDLRRDIEAHLKIKKSKIKEIRFREIGFAIRDLKPGKTINNKLKLKTSKYKSSNGTEYFIEFVNKDNILFGLCRLRINNTSKTAIVREVHVYGKALKIGEKAKFLGQHSGLGKQLIAHAEDITRKYKINSLKIISGIGAREYYKKLGYTLDKNNIYMEKKI
ncbi:tRNA uridine(34) 5-carboxymethylaminomethyl modification radical SAM/GNAT enzyme Elp3 [Candidatus Pacearchaeota archaeon]|nr:tRNA uridine(34) 5-carboxymethylaminomethyl modification radical SAM/GNAT enzyme Elp3 [Candidatus Pacearchaeota archaeon]